jgi:hypothetical protein
MCSFSSYDYRLLLFEWEKQSSFILILLLQNKKLRIKLTLASYTQKPMQLSKEV